MVQTTHSVVSSQRRTRTQQQKHSDAASTTLRGARIENLWILSVVGYTVLRFVVAWGAFGDHGTSPWIFGFIDIATAVPYAKAVALVCRRAAAFEWRRLPMPVAVALVSFFAPYAYLWFSAGSMPDGVRVGLAVCVSVLLLAATAGVVAKVRKLRRAAPVDITTRQSAASETSESEIVIDLTKPGTPVYTRSRVAS